MNFDQQKVFEGKRAFHRNLADRSVAEKLRMLDALRERELAIRGKREDVPSALREEPAPPRAGSK